MYKKTVTLFLITVMLFSISACGNQGDSKPVDETMLIDPVEVTEQIEEAPTIETPDVSLTASLTLNEAEPYYNDVILFQEGSKIGVMDNEGNVLINAEYGALKPLSPQYIKFQVERAYGTTGLLDIEGKVIVEPKYNEFLYINDTYVLAEWLDVETYLQANEIKMKHYLISLPDGSIVKQLDEKIIGVQEATIVGDILAIIAATKEGSGEYLRYDMNTWNEIECDYTELYSYYFDVLIGQEEATGRYEGWDGLNQSMKDLLGGSEYYTYTKEIYELRSADGTVFDEKFSLACASAYKNDPIPVSMKTDPDGESEFVYINTSGDVIIQGGFEEITSFDNRNSTPVKKEGYWGLIDKTGKALTKFIYNEIEYAKNGFYLVEIDDSYGFMDINGKITCPIEITDEKVSGKLHFKGNDDREYMVNPATGAKSDTYNYISSNKRGDGIIYEAGNGTGHLGWLIYEKEVIPTQYERSGISEDGKVILCNKGSTYDIYEVR